MNSLVRRIIFHLVNPFFKIRYYNNAEAYFNRAWASNNYYKDYDLAIADFTKAIEINPQYDDAYYERGNVYFDRATNFDFISYQSSDRDLLDYDLALADYNKAIAINPRHAHAHYFKGMTYDIKGVDEEYLKQEAIKAYQQFLALASPAQDANFIKNAQAKIQEYQNTK